MNIHNPYVEASKLHNEGKSAEAERMFVSLMDRDFDNPVLMFALGCALNAQRKSGLAYSLLMRAYEKMDYAHSAYEKLGIFPKEASIAEKKAFVKKQRSECCNSIAMCYRNEHKFEEAIQWFQKALALAPDDPDVLCNIGGLWVNNGNPSKGIPHCERALQIDPNHVNAKWNLSLLYLESHRYKEGFALYDAGERSRIALSRQYTYPDGKTLPVWDGSPGKRVLVYGEQGIGDEIMFASCVPDVIKVSKEVIFDCHPRLVSLFERSFGIKCYGTRKQEWLDWPLEHEIECRAPLGTLPHYFRNSKEEFPGTPYLKTEPMALSFNKPKVGISWIGGVKATRAAVRSIRLTDWWKVLRHDYDWVNLQYNKREDDLKEVEWKQGVKIHHYPEIIYADNYEETAKLVAGLDLVISVCTSVIHLAGALGVPCWILVPDKPAWRYGTVGEDMPWYKSVRLFRQRPGEQWVDVLNRVSDALEERFGTDTASRVSAKAA